MSATAKAALAEARARLAAARAAAEREADLVREARLAVAREERERAARERGDHEARMYAEYGEGIPEAFAGRIYAKAWEGGHSSGYEQVEQHYEELADLARDCIAAYEQARKGRE